MIGEKAQPKYEGKHYRRKYLAKLLQKGMFVRNLKKFNTKLRP